MPRVVRELGVTPSEYYDLPSTDDCLDLSQRGIENEVNGSVPREGRSGLRESGVEDPLRWEDTGLCQWDMPPLEELLARTGEESLLRDGLPPPATPPPHVGQFIQRLIDDTLGTQLSWLQQGPPETGGGLYPGMSGVEAQAEVEDQEGRWQEQEEGSSEDQTVDFCEFMTVEEKASLTQCCALCMTVADPAFNPWGSQYGGSKEAWERVLSEVNGQGHFLGKKYGFIQSRVNKLLMLHTGDGLARVTHGLTEKSVGLPPLSPLPLVDRYLIALQIEYLGGSLDKILELMVHGHSTSLKRTAEDADLDKGLASRILSLENHNTRQPERIPQDFTNNVTGSSEAITDTPRKKQKDNWWARAWAPLAAQGCVLASVTDSSMQSQLSSQTSNTIVETPIEYLQSLNSSPTGSKHVSTAELAGVFFHATEEREEKQSRFQEELLAEMREQTTAVEEMVRVVKELYNGRSTRA